MKKGTSDSSAKMRLVKWLGRGGPDYPRDALTPVRPVVPLPMPEPTLTPMPSSEESPSAPSHIGTRTPSSRHVVSPVEVGDILDDKYRVEKLLGVGGMGVVVVARHLKLDR